MTSNGADDVAPAPARRSRLSIEELARRKGVRAVESLDEMARDVFATDDEFVAFVRAERQAGVA